MHRRIALTAVAFVALLAFNAAHAGDQPAAAPAAAPQLDVNAAPSADGSCAVDETAVVPPTGGDLALTSEDPEVNFCSVDDDPLATSLSVKPQRRGFCRCGCGGSCLTSADCGGAPCDKFITCC